MQTKENEMALNSIFFERVLMESGRVLENLKNAEVLDMSELSYQEGRISLCYQIYRQNVRNPKLLEISEKRLEQVKELKEKHLNGGVDKEVDLPDAHIVDNPDVGIVKQETKISKEYINNMKSADLKSLVDSSGIVLEKYNVGTMRKALIGALNEEG